MTNFNIKNVGLTNSYQSAEFDPAGWKELGRTTLSAPTPTYETDFSSSTGWTTTNSSNLNIASGALQIVSTAGLASIYYDLTSITGDFLIRYTTSFTTMGSQSLGIHWTGVSDNTSNAQTNHDGLSFMIYDNSNNFQSSTQNGIRVDQSSDQGALTDTPNPTTGTDYFVELKRDGSNWITSLYNNADYDSVIATRTVSINAGITGLRYFKVMTYTTGADVGQIDDLKFYNGITDASGASDNILVSSLADKKYYMALASTEGGGSTTRSQSQVQMGSPPVTTVTYTGDYSTQVGWTSNNSRISITGGYAYMNNSGSSYGDYIYTPLGLTLSDDKWYLEFEYYNLGAINFYPFVLAAGTSLVGNNNVNQDFIGISESNPNMLMLRYKDGSSNITGNTNSSTMSTNTPYYCTISRDGQVLTFKMYTDTARTLQFGSTQTLTISGTVSGLTTLHHSGLNIGGGTSGYNFKVRGTKIWNGVTSTDNAWSEEGT